jgi:hypothetical protein
MSFDQKETLVFRNSVLEEKGVAGFPERGVALKGMRADVVS